ncbi:unnamed protein product [Rotaria socialis]
MFTATNDYFISPSPASPSGLVFNRQHHHSRYHPYDRVSASYYPTNELETYSYENNKNNSTTANYDHSIASYDYNLAWTTPCSSVDSEINIEGQRPVELQVARPANKKERRRTQSINTAFSDLRTAIPNVQADTKLSKIKTLKLATKYIEYLMDILSKDDPSAMPGAFKAEIIKTRRDYRDVMKFDNSVGSRKMKGRTGWPQAVWQSELNRNENINQYHSTNDKMLLSSPHAPHLLLDASTGSLSNSPTISHSSSSSSAKMNKSRTYEKPYSRK